MTNIFFYFVFLLSAGIQGSGEPLLSDELNVAEIYCCDQGIELEQDSHDTDAYLSKHADIFTAPQIDSPVIEAVTLIRVAVSSTHPIRAPPITFS